MQAGVSNVVVTVAVACSLAALGCGPSIVGRACDASDPCPTNFVCAPAHDGVDRCMRTCSLTETVCNDGTVCLPLATTGSGACYLGGNVGIGGRCASDLDCTRTAICIGAGSVTECRVGCNLDGTHMCSGALACQPASGGSGYCASM